MVAFHDPKQIAKIVQSCLNGNARGRSVRVVPDEIRSVRDESVWWYVPVTYQQDPWHAYEFFELFADVEEQVRSNEHVDILIVPRILPPPPGAEV